MKTHRAFGNRESQVPNHPRNGRARPHTVKRQKNIPKRFLRHAAAVIANANQRRSVSVAGRFLQRDLYFGAFRRCSSLRCESRSRWRCAEVVGFRESYSYRPGSPVHGASAPALQSRRRQQRRPPLDPAPPVRPPAFRCRSPAAPASAGSRSSVFSRPASSSMRSSASVHSGLA